MSSATAYEPVPVTPQTEDELKSSRHPGQCNALDLVQPRTLDRSAFDTLLLVATDMLMVLAWTGMFIYAALLWFIRDKFVDERTFSAAGLIGAATT
jgi:hypothetical protein